MKKCLPLLCALVLVLLSACAPEKRDVPPDPAETGPLALESLSVEISRGELSTEELTRAVRELPGALKAALADQGVEAETVTVSVGSSPAATVQAVREGGVDLAFMTGEDHSALEDVPRPLLSAAPNPGEEPDSSGSMVALVRPEDEALSGKAFAEALAAAVNSLREEQPALASPYDYAWMEPEAGE